MRTLSRPGRTLFSLHVDSVNATSIKTLSSPTPKPCVTHPAGGESAEESPIILVDLHHLMVPTLEAWVKRWGATLFEWVDHTIDAETKAVDPGRRWVPISATADSMFSFSVVDLYCQLQVCAGDVHCALCIVH